MITVSANLFAAVGIARSYEESRYYLNGIHFEKGFMVATDGHLLTVAHLPDYDGPNIILPASKKAIAAAARKGSDLVTWTGDVLTVEGARGTVHMEPCAPIDGTFPDWRKILPGDNLQHSPAAWSGEVMGRLCDTAAAFSIRVANSGTPATGFTLRSAQGSPDAPHLVRYATDAEIFSIAMPRRYTWDADMLPAWTKGD